MVCIVLISSRGDQDVSTEEVFQNVRMGTTSIRMTKQTQYREVAIVVGTLRCIPGTPPVVTMDVLVVDDDVVMEVSKCEYRGGLSKRLEVTNKHQTRPVEPIERGYCPSWRVWSPSRKRLYIPDTLRYSL